MAPYRSDDVRDHVEVPRDQGIVGEVIAQFADPLAFYRELVQNAIDAGSPRVEVTLGFEAGHVRVRVADRGSGMTRDILENQLLVLFRSTKEQDATKIGRFGIGFTSVLAPRPALVVVTTARDGKRLVLHLKPDLTYELFDGGNATQAGTTVELELPIAEHAAADFAKRSYQAVVRWCRHASVPIELTAEIPGLAASLGGRIDRPLALDDALVEVRATSPDGQLTAVLGLERRTETYLGFFNHGLTLFECGEPLVGWAVACKLQDARLGHTLSRDNVRRDAHFDAAIAFARELAADDLVRACGRELRTAAEAGDHARHTELMRAIAAAVLQLSADDWWLPLAVPVGERTAISVAELPDPIWVTSRPSRLAAAFAGADMPIPLVPAEEIDRLARILSALPTARRVLQLDEELVHVHPCELDERSTAVVHELAALLRECKRAPAEILIAELEGADATRFALGGGRDAARVVEPDGDYVLASTTASKPPIGRFTRETLVLSADHELVRAALAAPDPRVAASHLARTILLAYGQLDVGRSERILAHGLAALGLGEAP